MALLKDSRAIQNNCNMQTPPIRRFAAKTLVEICYWKCFVLKHEGAIPYARKAAQLDPANNKAQSMLGYLEIRHGNAKYKNKEFDAAIRFYDLAKLYLDRAIELTPGNPRAFYYRGVANLQSGALRRDEKCHDLAAPLLKSAILDFTKALKMFPNLSRTYLLRGIANETLGSIEAGKGNGDIAKKYYDGALSDYNDLLFWEPNNIEAYAHRSSLKRKLKDGKGADEDLQMATKLCGLMRIEASSTLNNFPIDV